MTEIAPSILSADFARLGEQIEEVKRAGAKMIHVDVMDGHFVPNITIGPPVVASLRAATDLFLDCHLMIERPDAFVREFVRAGAQSVTVHQEACPHLHRTLQATRDEGAACGVAINPATPVETLEHVLEMVDMVLVMSVNPGFGGQKFLPLALEKIARLDRKRRECGLDYRIEVDGGIVPENVGDVVRAGADVIVAGSSIFGTSDSASAVQSLKDRIEEASLLRA